MTRPVARNARRGASLAAEPLEPRRLMSTYTVTIVPLTLSGSTENQNSVDAESQGVDAVNTAGGFLAVPAAGGGVYAGAAATLSLDTVDADVIFGGPAAAGPAATAAGGGVAVLPASTITGSTLDHDSVTGGGGYYGDAGEAGHAGGVYASGVVTVTDSTVVDDTATGGVPTQTGGKSAAGGGAGGGCLFTTAGLTLAFNTVTGNAATGGAGTSSKLTGPAAAGGATLTDWIVSADTAGDIAGTVATRGNLIGVGGGLADGTNGNHVGVTDPKLAALADNGGPTQTELPLAGSPEIDAGSAASVAVPAADQRVPTRPTRRLGRRGRRHLRRGHLRRILTRPPGPGPAQPAAHPGR